MTEQVAALTVWKTSVGQNFRSMWIDYESSTHGKSWA